MTRHAGWEEFRRDRGPGRLVLFTTKGATPLNAFAFEPDDVLLFGSESSGAPDFVHQAADARVVIPIRPEARSLNLSVSAGIALWEGLRQVRL
jgi:tRNA (cytidine/uridine-2'-O-)-methyltransferase